MIILSLKDELAKAIPFRIEYNFEQAYTDFRQAHPETDELLSKKWRNAFELAARAELEEASCIFEGLSRGPNGDAFSALFNGAMCHLLNGRVSDAAIFFSKAATLFPDDYWLHIYAGITDFTLGLISRANRHWWAALRIKEDDFVLSLLQRFFLDEHHPERMALYPLCQGRGIDVGCGHRKTHPDAIGVDLVANGESPTADSDSLSLRSQADIVCSGDDLNVFEDESLDYVVQRHNLEHYQDPLKALQEWIRVLRPGGILGMIVPDDEVLDTIGMDKTHKHAFTQSSLQRILDLLSDVRVVYMAPLIYRWSFICVAQKVDRHQSVPFDYQACINKQQISEIQSRIDLYTKGGLHGLASQGRRYMELCGLHRGMAKEAATQSEHREVRGQPLFLGIDKGNVHGWGICSRYLKNELSRRIPVEDLSQGEPARGNHRLPGKVLHALTGAEFFPLFEHVRGERNYGYTFFEKRLGQQSVENAKTFDLVLAGSTWCRDRMLEKGIENCDVLIQGVDPELFFPVETAPRSDRFVIFSGGKFELRKGQDLVLKAVKILQERHSDVWLINCWYNSWPASIRMMESSPHISFSYRKDLSWQKNMQRLYAINELDAGRIITHDLVDHAELRSLYAQTDIGVFPNRCEGGTNLVLMEYMACAKPVIASNCSGHKDILTQDNAIRLNDLKEIRIVEGGGAEIGIWEEPHLDDLVDCLEHAYANRTAIAQYGLRAGEDLKMMSWAHTAERLLTLIED